MIMDRVQGLIDLYLKAGKSRPAVETMADYYLHQGIITQADFDTIMSALDAQDAQAERIDIAAVITQRDALMAENADIRRQIGAKMDTGILDELGDPIIR